MNNLIAKEYKCFEDIKHLKEDGTEYWLARELAIVLDYNKWENFHKVIKRAMIACENSGHDITCDFPEVRKIVKAGATEKPVLDYELTRYACYLIVQNGDPRKEGIALGQTYFAIQTYRQEVADRFNQLDEDSRRLVVRGDIKQWNQLLAETARNAGVITNEEFAIFQNAGYMGLYGGLDVEDIHKRKGLVGQKILDYMGSTELIANLFRISQTEEKEQRMNINFILNGVKCDCGKEHNCSIEKVYIESGAIKRLTQLCSDYNTILLVADGNTFSAAGAEVEKALTDKILKKVIFSGEKLLIPDETAIEEVKKKTSETELIIGIGSGVIQDLCKYVSFFSKIPYMIVATAPSMDGYASDGAAMILGGMKETIKAGLPKAIIADVDVLRNAPMEMIKAGYGDIVGKYSALCDWKLSAAVTGEYFCQYIYDTTFQMIERTLETAQGLLERDIESIKILTEALMVVGVMMSFAGSSRPASGSEHHLSHFFEIVGIVNSEDYFPHGIDVAYSTIETSKLREEIVKSDFPDKIYRPTAEEYTEKMNEIYKSVSEGCISLQKRIGNYSKDRIQTYKQKEEEIKNILSQMPNSKEIEQMLSVVGLDLAEFYNLYDKQKIQDAVLYAKDLKDRYTVLWLYYDLFGNKIYKN